MESGFGVRKWSAAMVMAILVLSCLTREGWGAGMSCEDAVSALIPCGSFLMGSGPKTPSRQCCSSAQSLNKMVLTTNRRRAVCNCFVKSGPSFGVKPERAKLLPPLCKLNLNIPISPKTDCSKVA